MKKDDWTVISNLLIRLLSKSKEFRLSVPLRLDREKASRKRIFTIARYISTAAVMETIYEGTTFNYLLTFRTEWATLIHKSIMTVKSCSFK